jgi:Dr1-associated corepressor
MTAMSDENHNYRPRSPDLSTSFVPPPSLGRLPSYSRTPGDSNYPFSPRASIDVSATFTPQSATAPSYFSNQHQVQSPAAFARTPSFPSYPAHPSNYQSYQANTQPRLPPNFQQPNYAQPNYPVDDMARTRAQRSAEQNYDPSYNPHDSVTAPMAQAPPPIQAPPPPVTPEEPAVDPALLMEVRTKFPVARIKRIMQADEDIGKVAQATPTAAAKALELFLASLTIRSASVARNNNSKRITVNHLKSVISENVAFDFLSDICDAAPDEEKGGKKSRGKSEEGSDDEAAGKRKIKKRKNSEESD